MELSYPPDVSHVFITSRTAAEWVSKALRKHHDTSQATAVIKGLSIPELTYHEKQRFPRPPRGTPWRPPRVRRADTGRFPAAPQVPCHVGSSLFVMVP